MLQSPSKKRKLDDSRSKNIHHDTNNAGKPITPTRASYLSPTKSSLARSHPHLITQPTNRFASRSRGKALREDVLGSKKEESSSQEPRSTTRTSHNQDLNDQRQTQADDDTADQPPAVADGTHIPKSKSSPQTPGQSPNSSRSKRFVWPEEPIDPIIIPKLVPRSNSTESPRRRARSGEPDLPPTPVALGLTAPPERPRGLAFSSSPRNSTMSSGSRRRRIRTGELATSSPIRNKAQSPRARNEQEGEIEDSIIRDEFQEAAESEANPENEADEEESNELREQRPTIASLRQELQRLTQENERLEEAIGTGDLNSELWALLQQPFHTHSMLKRPRSADDISSHLRLFAAGNLQLTSRTETRLVDNRTTILHTLFIDPPPLWSRHALFCQVEVTVDAENVQVEQVAFSEDMMAGRIQSSEIYKWLRQRSADPIHRFDVSGMVWAMGRWFNAAIERAKIFRWIDLQYNKLEAQNGDDQAGSEGDLTRDRIIVLTRYLYQTQITASDAAVKNNNEDNPVQMKMLLTWHLDLDWAGGLSSNIHISTSGLPSSACSSLKATFASLIPKIGVKAAFENIWALVHGEEASPGSAKPAVQRKGNPRNESSGSEVD